MPESTATAIINAGWNLVSLPLKVANAATTAVFPGANSSAFAFENGYVAADTLQNGVGYWLHFDSAQTVTIAGYPIYPETLNVNAGWNLVGTEDGAVSVQNIGRSDSGLTLSYFHSYSSAGYAVADTLYPFPGYWVRSDTAAQLYLTSPPGKASFKHHPHISQTAAVPPPPPVFATKVKQVPKGSLGSELSESVQPFTRNPVRVAHDSYVTIQVYNILGQEVMGSGQQHAAGGRSIDHAECFTHGERRVSLPPHGAPDRAKCERWSSRYFYRCQENAAYQIAPSASYPQLRSARHDFSVLSFKPIFRKFNLPGRTQDDKSLI